MEFSIGVMGEGDFAKKVVYQLVRQHAYAIGAKVKFLLFDIGFEFDQGFITCISDIVSIEYCSMAQLDDGDIDVIYVAYDDDSYEEVKSGTVNEMYLSIEDLRNLDFPGHYKGYMLLSGTVEHFRVPKVIKKLYGSWAELVKFMAVYLGKDCFVFLAREEALQLS